MIKRTVTYVVLQYLLCLCIFLCIQKPLFLLFNWNHGASACTFHDLVAIYYHGFALDAATAGYLTVLPWLLLLAHLLFPAFNPRRIIIVYDACIAMLLAVITLADASLYEFWEFKLDATVFFYLNDPKNAFASVSGWYILVRSIAIVLLAVVIYFVLTLPANRIRFQPAPCDKRVPSLLIMLLLGGCLFGTIRGVRIWPNTPGRAFYSKTAFHNHAALNPLFNIAYTSMQTEKFDKQFQFFTQEKCEQIYAPLFPRQGKTKHILRTTRPNILVIVLEGFGACFIEELGGLKEVGPNISRISKESVNFTHCYCSSFRTDRGIVAALSGYLGQPTTSIMRYSHKIQSLPGLPKTLKKYGYKTEVLYASDMTFFNMSDYFISAGHDKLISQNDFPRSLRTAKWGVPDHEAFNRLYQDIQQKQEHREEPWYTTFLTLSSHTPFDVPYHKLEDEKLNAFAYTDSCLNDFVERIKKTPAWDNLLIVCTADHGFNHREITSPDFPHIPMLLSGGAITEPCRIDALMSQTDLPATLLGQLDIPHKEFIFSRDVLADTYTYPFAFNTFNNGFNFRDSTGCTVYDNVANEALTGPDERREETGKAILQTLYEDLSKR